jgi:indolepyruvate ferredoxin oxidoreductase
MDERFLKEEGLEVFTGNELILKGGLESGIALLTGYPGSPVSDVFEAASANSSLLKKHGILAEMANNEALAVARLNGSRMVGVRALAVMKSVGLNVASDGLALGNLSEPCNEGGSVVVVGDDPWIDSTQINNDSRYLSQHLHMPILEPATFQEIKDWVGTAFELSSAANLYITYLVTTHQADGGGTVWVRPNQYPTVNTHQPVTIDTAQINLDKTVLLPPRTWAREATLPQRFETLLSEARKKNMNRLINPREGQRYPLGLIASGMTYCYLEHALSEMGLSGQIPILKLGITYPVDPQAVLELAHQVDTIYIIEEKRGFIESQVIQTLSEARQNGTLARSTPVWGKKFPNGLEGIPIERGLNASILMERLIPLFLSSSSAVVSRGSINGMMDSPLVAAENDGQKDDVRSRLLREQAILETTAKPLVSLPSRTPTFCPGCPHRDSSSVFLQIKKDFLNADYMQKTHDRAPIDVVFHGETGCFTMLMFEPNAELMHNYSGMGLGGGTGAGLDPFITNKQVVFLGDSTFFHSGLIAISDSIKNGQDITYVILDNKTTAMTGHQPTPGTEANLMGEATFAQNIEKIIQGMVHAGEVPLTRVNPGYRDSYRVLLEETILKDGVKIVIADKECGITYQRRVRKEKKTFLRRKGYLPEETHVNITPEVCEFCLECTKTTGCPGLTLEETLYGPKIVTDLTHCVADGACAKVKACPSFEDVIVHRKAPSRLTPVLPSLEGTPDPVLPTFERTWNIYTAGVGGQGAGVVSAILVLAAHKQGYRVLFSDKKGLAIRNGGVFGHVLFSKEGGTLAPLVPYGKADLILGIDLLEATRGLDPRGNLRVANAERSHAVVNTATHPTVQMLMGKETSHSSAYEDLLKKQVQPEGYYGADFSMFSEHYFGSKLFTNMMLLGAAYQRGTLPLGLDALETAIRQSVPREDQKVNIDAFRAGRKLVVDPQVFDVPRKIYTYASLLSEKTRFLDSLNGPATAQTYKEAVEEAVFQLGLDDATHMHLALRMYDLVCYKDLATAQRYADLVLTTAEKDRASWGYQATQAVLKQAFKVIAIKDEVYVAHLLTSPEKYQRDRARFRIDEAQGDRLEYRHINRPEFVLFGKTVRWDMTTRDWQLRLMRRLKCLRDWLPAWHREEKEFRDWYLAVAGRFDADDETSYRLWVQILNTPENVRGYRDIRRPTMVQARRDAEKLLTQLSQKSREAALPEHRHHQKGSEWKTPLKK